VSCLSSLNPALRVILARLVAPVFLVILALFVLCLGDRCWAFAPVRRAMAVLP
jgi:hypothetical protein